MSTGVLRPPGERQPMGLADVTNERQRKGLFRFTLSTEKEAFSKRDLTARRNSNGAGCWFGHGGLAVVLNV